VWADALCNKSRIVIRGAAVPAGKAAMSDPTLTEFFKTAPHLADFLKLAPCGWRVAGLPSLPDTCRRQEVHPSALAGVGTACSGRG
jgi:hypothetical protein